MRQGSRIATFAPLALATVGTANLGAATVARAMPATPLASGFVPYRQAASVVTGQVRYWRGGRWWFGPRPYYWPGRYYAYPYDTYPYPYPHYRPCRCGPRWGYSRW